MRAKSLQLFIFLGIGILSYLAIQSIFYETIYHSDNLYLPLLARDVKDGSFTHWYFPPSTYVFPDLLLMFLLKFLLPDLYLPLGFGIFQFYLLIYLVYLYVKRESGKQKALFTINLLVFILMICYYYEFLDESSINPFVFLFTSGHHCSSLLIFFISLVAYKNSNAKKGSHRLAFIFLLFLFTYVSDRFFMIFLVSGFFLFRKSRFQVRQITSLFGLLLVSELLLSLISHAYRIPNNFDILVYAFKNKNLSENFYLFIRYFYDFGKIYFLKVSPIFHLVMFSFLFFSFVFKFRYLPLRFLGSLGLSSFLFLGIVGRFVFPHAFPIRYLFPFLFCLILFFCLSFIKNVPTLSVKTFQLLQRITFLLLLATTVNSYWLAEIIIDQKHDYRNLVLSSLIFEMKKSSFWTSYEAEKKIRFWSQNQLEPLPCSPSGKPYLWITGAFVKMGTQEGNCLSPGSRTWIPNSLTKDF